MTPLDERRLRGEFAKRGLDLAVFRENLHPRALDGKWIPKVGTSALDLVKGGSTAIADDAVIHDVGDDLNEAAELLAQGKRVRLKQERSVSTLVDRLGKIVNAMGADAPTFDLCKVSVKGTNLFCQESKGVPRVQMPQLKGVPTPGTRAAKLEPDKRGEVDLQPMFRKYLEDKGVEIKNQTEPASYLRATQNELNGGKVSGITGYLRGGGTIEGPPIFTSADDYIVDGHHRWAADIALDVADGKTGDVTMDIARVNMGITELLYEANKFAAEWGIPQAGLGTGFGPSKPKK